MKLHAKTRLQALASGMDRKILDLLRDVLPSYQFDRSHDGSAIKCAQSCSPGQARIVVRDLNNEVMKPQGFHLDQKGEVYTWTKSGSKWTLVQRAGHIYVEGF